METINWNNMSESNYERIDYMTINGHSVNLEVVTGISIGEDRVSVGFILKHGLKSFHSMLLDMCSEPEKFSIRCSNYHGGYFIVHGEITFDGDIAILPPGQFNVNFKATGIVIDTYSSYAGETVYLTKIEPKE